MALPFLRNRRSWRATGGDKSFAQKDEKLYAHWAGRALALLKEGSVPSWEEAGTEEVRRGLLGKTRASTLRLRVRTWESYVRWLQWRRGRSWPSSQSDLTDYITERMQEHPAASFPLALLAALHWFESRSGLPAGRRFGKSETLKFILDQAEMETTKKL